MTKYLVYQKKDRISSGKEKCEVGLHHKVDHYRFTIVTDGILQLDYVRCALRERKLRGTFRVGEAKGKPLGFPNPFGKGFEIIV